MTEIIQENFVGYKNQLNKKISNKDTVWNEH